MYVCVRERSIDSYASATVAVSNFPLLRKQHRERDRDTTYRHYFYSLIASYEILAYIQPYLIHIQLASKRVSCHFNMKLVI